MGNAYLLMSCVFGSHQIVFHWNGFYPVPTYYCTVRASEESTVSHGHLGPLDLARVGLFNSGTKAFEGDNPDPKLLVRSKVAQH